MKHAYAHVQSVLAEYGATMDNVVDETWFVTDIDTQWRKSGICLPRAEIYGKKPEVSQTLVQVAGLVDPSFKIEIKCVASL